MGSISPFISNSPTLYDTQRLHASRQTDSAAHNLLPQNFTPFPHPTIASLQSLFHSVAFSDYTAARQMLGVGKTKNSQDTDLVDALNQLFQQCTPTVYTSLDTMQLKDGAPSKTSMNSLLKHIIIVLQAFVDFEQNYHTMRFLDTAQQMDYSNPLHVRVQQVGEKLAKVLIGLQQPIDGFASLQWWICARLRHIFHNMEVYITKKQYMSIEYKEFKQSK